MNALLRRRMIAVTALAAVALGWANGGDAPRAQESTERYIPIGESPGVSGTESLLGSIRDVDYATKRLMVAADGERVVQTDDRTQFYLDRSDQKKPNETVTIRACKLGERVEIKMREDGMADWVKIQAD